jgi:hypothetical protein
MTKQLQSGKITRKDLTSRALRAAAKTALAFALYVVLVLLLAPVFDLVPGFAETVQIFFIVYVVLMVVGEFTAKTIFQPILNGVRAVFVLFYMVLALGDNVIIVTAENTTLALDMSLVFTVAIVLCLVGVASAALEAINFLSERAERESVVSL